MELSAVVFPDTLLSEGMLVPLVPVFSPLVYLQPVENDPDSAAGRGGLAAELLRQDFCRLHVPAPLGPDRERFLRLVADIRGRRDDYAAQLGHQTLAGISAASGKRSETKSSIVGSLLAGHGIREEDGDRRRLLLWQARLLLKLAEMQVADQEELRHQVQRIQAKEQGMLAGLRDEAELPFALTGALAESAMDAGALRQQRKAWARLLALGETPPASGIFISRDGEYVDLLTEEFELRTGQPPVLLGQIALPATCAEPAEYIDRVRGFREEAGDLLLRLHEGITGAVGDAAPAGLGVPEQAAWAELLERHFPENRCGRTRLTLYACSGRSAERLFAETFAPEEQEFLHNLEKPAKAVFLGVLQG